MTWGRGDSGAQPQVGPAARALVKTAMLQFWRRDHARSNRLRAGPNVYRVLAAHPVAHGPE
jgi:hypothetical protein